MVLPSTISIFPSEIWFIILQWLETSHIGKLMLSGNRFLAQKLVEGGVKEWRCEIGPSRIAKRAWPMIIREFRHLRSFSLAWDERYRLETLIDVSHLSYLPKGLEKVELDLSGRNEPLLLPWHFISSHFPHLRTLDMRCVVLDMEIPDLSSIQALETLILSPINSVLDLVLLGLPSSLTTFEYYHTDNLRLVPARDLSFHALPRLRTLKLHNKSKYTPSMRLNTELRNDGPLFPDSLTSLHLGTAYDLIVQYCAEYEENPFPASLTELTLPSVPLVNEIAMRRAIFPEGLTKLAIPDLYPTTPGMVSKLPRSLLHFQFKHFDGNMSHWNFPPHLEVLGQSVNADWLHNHADQLPMSIQSLKVVGGYISVIPLLHRRLTSLYGLLNPCNAHLLPSTITFLDFRIPTNFGMKILPPFPETLTFLKCALSQNFPLTFLPQTHLTTLKISVTEEVVVPDPNYLSPIPACVKDLELHLDAKITNESLGQLVCMPTLTSFKLELEDPILDSSCFALLGPSLRTLHLDLDHIDPENCPTLPRSLRDLKLNLRTFRKAQPELSYHALSQALLSSSVGILTISPTSPGFFQQWAAEHRIRLMGYPT